MNHRKEKSSHPRYFRTIFFLPFQALLSNHNLLCSICLWQVKCWHICKCLSANYIHVEIKCKMDDCGLLHPCMGRDKFWKFQSGSLFICHLLSSWPKKTYQILKGIFCIQHIESIPCQEQYWLFVDMIQKPFLWKLWDNKDLVSFG